MCFCFFKYSFVSNIVHDDVVSHLYSHHRLLTETETEIKNVFDRDLFKAMSAKTPPRTMDGSPARPRRLPFFCRLSTSSAGSAVAAIGPFLWSHAVVSSSASRRRSACTLPPWPPSVSLPITVLAPSRWGPSRFGVRSSRRRRRWREPA